MNICFVKGIRKGFMLLILCLSIFPVACVIDNEKSDDRKSYLCNTCPFEQRVIIDSSTFSINKNGVCYCKYQIGDSSNRLSFYLGRESDTLFLIKNSDILLDSPLKITFLPIGDSVNTYFKYGDYLQFANNYYASGDGAEFRLLSKTFSEKDTIYKFSHTCVPAEIIEITKESGMILPSITREFELSLRRGILEFKETEKKGYKKIEFHWD